ncbi:hypothetical protein B0H19DRAFT_1061642 [Mycena capillaripes]|nr:hypothetical protein B0H19DRAFT_1061642 [Mycena capillaripes]
MAPRRVAHALQCLCGAAGRGTHAGPRRAARDRDVGGGEGEAGMSVRSNGFPHPSSFSAYLPSSAHPPAAGHGAGPGAYGGSPPPGFGARRLNLPISWSTASRSGCGVLAGVSVEGRRIVAGGSAGLAMRSRAVACDGVGRTEASSGVVWCGAESGNARGGNGRIATPRVAPGVSAVCGGRGLEWRAAWARHAGRRYERRGRWGTTMALAARSGDAARRTLGPRQELAGFQRRIATAAHAADAGVVHQKRPGTCGKRGGDTSGARDGDCAADAAGGVQWARAALLDAAHVAPARRAAKAWGASEEARSAVRTAVLLKIIVTNARTLPVRSGRAFGIPDAEDGLTRRQSCCTVSSFHQDTRHGVNSDWIASGVENEISAEKFRVSHSKRSRHIQKLVQTVAGQQSLI